VTRAARLPLSAAALFALALACPAARADDDPPARGRGAWQSFRAGVDLAASVPTAAVIDGIWSISLQLNTQLLSRTWAPPYPWGTIGHYSTRALYGMSWTAMLGIESLAVVLAAGGRLDWIGAASYRTDWILPMDLPVCTRAGAAGGCGVGVGNFAFLQIRPDRSRWWYEAGGGWIQQRVLNDELRTVNESSWVLTPISVLREVHTDYDDPVAFRLLAGPGVYFGMHAAHMHPTTRGASVYPRRPITEIYPLDAGIGPGARLEGRIIFAQHVSLEGELVVAPFLAGGPSAHVSHDVAPLDYARDGVSVWRKVGLGIGFELPEVLPFKATLAFYGSELSSRPVDRIGDRGGMIRFEIPLRVPKDD
jgi:hypothetical protein